MKHRDAEVSVGMSPLPFQTDRQWYCLSPIHRPLRRSQHHHWSSMGPHHHPIRVYMIIVYMIIVMVTTW